MRKMIQNLINISSKKLIVFRNTKRFKPLFLIQNIYTKHTNNGFNKLLFNDKNSRFILNISRWPPKPSLVLGMSSTTESLDAFTYERIVGQTLNYLYEELEAIIEANIELLNTDISLNNGVITLNLGLHGIYVINKQTPNKQIWFSSPLSGPKRYDYINGEWLYKRDGISLLNTLNSELSVILKREINIKPLKQ